MTGKAGSAERIRDLLTSARLRQAGIRSAPDLSQPSVAESAHLWSRPNLAGRLVEISGARAVASLTAAVGLVRDAQAGGEPVVWITLPRTTFYPPDVADSGVDLASLAVVRVPDGRTAARAADRLIRSGAFGLVVLDLGTDGQIATALQGRLVGLAQKHDSAVVCVTAKNADAPSIGSMVSLRVEALREPLELPGRFRCKLRVLKDKQRGPSWQHAEEVRGPAGLR
jgi:recombination protein RecA